MSTILILASDDAGFRRSSGRWTGRPGASENASEEHAPATEVAASQQHRGSAQTSWSLMKIVVEVREGGLCAVVAASLLAYSTALPANRIHPETATLPRLGCGRGAGSRALPAVSRPWRRRGGGCR